VHTPYQCWVLSFNKFGWLELLVLVSVSNQNWDDFGSGSGNRTSSRTGPSSGMRSGPLSRVGTRIFENIFGKKRIGSGCK
jgi:hypothetical protein